MNIQSSALRRNSKTPMKRSSIKWFVDSGCSNHMAFNKQMFSSYTTARTSSVELGYSDSVRVPGIRTEIPISVPGKWVNCILKAVLHVPGLEYQLLLVPYFDKAGYTTSFHSKCCWISYRPKLLATATMMGNLYKMDVRSALETTLLGNSAHFW